MTVVPGVKLRAMVCGGGTKEAVTDCGADMVTEQPAVPVQAFPHPPKVLVPLGVAVRVTTVPLE